MAPRCDVAYLVGSEARPALLSACSQRETRPCDLAERCQVSRATVHRALNGFLDRGWIKKLEGHYSTTPFGERVLEQYNRLLEATERANEFGPWYQNVVNGDWEMPIESIWEGSVVTSGATDPTAPLEFVSTVVTPTDDSSIRLCVPSCGILVTQIAERINDTSGEFEIVLPEEVYSERASRLGDLTAGSQLSACSTDMGMPCGILILETPVVLLAFDDSNRLVSALKTNASEARSWAIDAFESIASSANSQPV